MTKHNLSDAEKSLLDILRQTNTDPGDLGTVILKYPAEIRKVIQGVRVVKEQALKPEAVGENELLTMLFIFISAIEEKGIPLNKMSKNGPAVFPIIYSNLTVQNLKQLYSHNRIDLHLPENAETFDLSTKMARMETADGELLTVQLGMPEKTLCIRLTEDNQGLFY